MLNTGEHIVLFDRHMSTESEWELYKICNLVNTRQAANFRSSIESSEYITIDENLRVFQGDDGVVPEWLYWCVRIDKVFDINRTRKVIMPK